MYQQISYCPLVEPGDRLEAGSSSGVALTNGVPRGSVAVSAVGHGDKGSVSVGQISRLSISTPLSSQSLGRPGNEGGGSSGVSSNSSQTISVAIGVSIGSVVVGSVQVSWVSLGFPLAVVRSAAIAGGLDAWGAYSGPVGVGVVQGGIGSVEVSRVSLSLSLTGGNGDNGSSNLDRRRLL